MAQNGRALVRSSAGVSVDLFGTLVTVERPDDPAAAIARELDSRGVTVPDDWPSVYSTQHLDVKQGAECPLGAHVTAAVAGREDAAIRPTVEEAVTAAFRTDAAPRSGAVQTIRAVADRRPVGVLSNCAVAGVAEHALDSAGIDIEEFEAVVTSVDCGWRKPNERAFAAVADELGVTCETLLHIGDDPRTDGGIEAAGGSSLIVGDGTLAAWEVDRWD